MHETGLAIVARFRGMGGESPVDPAAVPACLIAGHAPFVWGKTPHDAAHNAVKVRELAEGLEAHRAGQTGLLRLSWDNGDRTVLVNPELGGITLGWNLLHTAQDELFAAIEGTAFHSRPAARKKVEPCGEPSSSRDACSRVPAAYG